MEERGNGRGQDHGKSHVRGDRGRGDRGRGDRGREDRGRGDRGREDRGRGDRGRDDPEQGRRSEQNPRARESYGSRDRRDESHDRHPKRSRYDEGAVPSSAQQFSGGWSRGASSSVASSSAGPSGSGDSLTIPRGFGRGRGRGRSRLDEVIVCRPAHITDTKGTDQQQYSKLVANYYKATSTPNWKVFQYHTDFEPEVDNTRLKRAFVNSAKDTLGVYIFDGSSLFTIQRLGDAEEFEAHATRKTDNADITIKFKLVKELPSTDPILLQIFNILLRKCFRFLNLQQFNRNYYDPALADAIVQHSLEVWPGFIASIRRYESDVLLHADLAFKILRTDSVLEQLTAIRRANPNNYHDEVIRSIVGCIVLTRYNNRTYKIDDIDWERNPLSTFTTKDGSQIRFKDYYQNHWNLMINNDSQPLLISRPRERDQSRGVQSDILLVPELTYMTGLSETTRKDFQIMRAIASHTRIDPGERVRKLMAIMGRIQGDPQSRREMSNWNLNFDNNLIKLQGRVLPDELIFQKRNNEQYYSYKYTRDKSDWTQNMRDNKMYRAVAINRWLLIYAEKNGALARSFLSTLKQVCLPMGIGLAEPNMIPLDNDNARAYVEAIKSSLNSSVQLVVCLLFKQAKDRYDAIKKVCCIERPVPSQVVTARILDPKKIMSVATKIGIQINCKVGGAPWAVKFTLSDTMVIGYDAYRDSSRRGTSVGALCCSLDKDLTKYYSRVCFQTGETEMIDGLVENLAAGLKRFKQLNSKFPTRIIFYRDGVSEGQLLSIRDNELSRILDTLKQLEITAPKFAFIVVSKRINTRLMEEKNGQIRNPTPGTVVDTVITRNEWYDFFLVSQSVNQGTVSPTHFNIIHDTTGLKPNHMQRLAYKLTHLYFNWPGTVRVPAPCVYAHKLAFLTSQSLHMPHNEQLADSLFFL